MLQKNKIYQSIAALVLTLFAGSSAFSQEEAIRIEPVDPVINSPKERLRGQIFDGSKEPGCQMIRATGKDALASLDKDLDGFVRELSEAIKTRDDKRLQPLFHRRTNTSLPAINESFARMASVVGTPFNVSVYKLWALNTTIEGTPTPVSCTDEGVTVYPLYGYPLQFGIWLQVQGKTEIGRIFLSVVPAEGRWNIGSYHFHQWTHAAKDPGDWVQDAFNAKAANDSVGAYMRLDLAKKLLNAGRFLEIPAAKDAEVARDGIMSTQKFDDLVRMGASKEDIPFVTTLLVVEGVGILYRMRVPGEISTEDIKNRCRAHAIKVKKEAWAKGVTGIRCSYLMPKEAPEREGVLGGIYYALADVK